MVRIFALIVVATLAVLALFRSLNSVGNRAAEEAYYRHAERINKEVRAYLADDNFPLACAELQYAVKNERLALYSISSEGRVLCPSSVQAGASKDWYQTHIKNGVFDLSSQMTIGNSFAEPIIFFQDQVGTYRFAMAGVRAKMQTKDGMKYDTYRISFLNSLIFMALFGLFYAYLVTRKHLIVFRARVQEERAAKLPLIQRLLYRLSALFEDKELTAVSDSFQEVLKHNKRVSNLLAMARTSLNETIREKVLSDSRIELPYRVHGWVAIPDVSGYSGSDAVTKSEITRFLKTDAIEILVRYQGALQAVSGDDMAVTFVEHDDKHLLALAFVRDLMKRISEEGIVSDGVKKLFTMKSGLAASDIVFEMGRDGFGTSGEAFTPSKRLADAVPESEKRNSNWLVILKQDYDLLKELLGPVIRDELINLKGLGPKQVLFFNSFRSLQDVAASDLRLLKYFRQDADLGLMLEMIKQLESEKAMELCRQMRNLETRFVSAELFASLISLFNELLVRSKQNFDARVLSELVWVAKALISKEQWNSDLSALLLSIPAHIDERLNSNVIDVLILRGLSVEVYESLNDKYLKQTTALVSDRVRGSLLSARMIVQLEAQCFDLLIAMLNSKKENLRKTGIYCAYVVFNHYRKNRPGFIELQSGYGKALLTLRRMKNLNLDTRMSAYYHEASMSEALSKNLESQGL